MSRFGVSVKLRVCFANDGDGRLLSLDDKRNVLVDGEHSPATFEWTTAPTLQQLQRDGEALDSVVVAQTDSAATSSKCKPGVVEPCCGCGGLRRDRFA